MATTVLNKIADELAELEQELHKFKSSVEYINSAKDSLNTAIQSVTQAENYHLEKLEKIEKAYEGHNKIVADVSLLSEKINTVDFPARLTSIDEGLADVINGIEHSTKTTLDELKKAAEVITKANFDGRFNNLNTIINNTATKTEATSTLLKNQNEIQTRDIKESFRVLKQNAEQLSQDQKSFIEKLNLPLKFEKLESSVSGIMAAIQAVQSRLDSVERNVTDKMRDLIDKQKELQTSMQANVDASVKKQQICFYITWVIIIVGLIVSISLRR